MTERSCLLSDTGTPSAALAGPSPGGEARDSSTVVVLGTAGSDRSRIEAAVGSDPHGWQGLARWHRAARSEPVVVLVVGDAIEGAQRLAEHGAIPFEIGLARYERSLRQSLEACRGRDVVIVAEHDEVLARHCVDTLLSGTAASPGVADVRLPLAAADGRDSGAPGAGAVPAALSETVSTVLANRGLHLGFVPPALPPPDAWIAAIMAADGEAAGVANALRWAGRRIEEVLRADTAATRRAVAATGASPPGDDDAQFREPEDHGPYRLNAGQDRHAYHRWLAWHRRPAVIGGVSDTPLRRAVTRPRRTGTPTFSVIVPVWRTPLWALERCVGSVLAQTIPDWELCLCDDASGDAELTRTLRALSRLDRRIKVTALERNGGISAATNAAAAMAKGSFVAFLDHDDELAPFALERVAEAIAAAPDADLIYSDEDKIDANGERFDPLFKPDWSPDLLLSFAYLCHLTVIRRSLLTELGGLRSEFDGSQDYDLSLRASEVARRVVHIPDVLYHWRSIPGSAASDGNGAVAKPWAYEAGRRAIASALDRRNEPGEVTEDARFPGRYHVRRRVTGHPLVSIVIPFRDEPEMLATCAASLRDDPGYDRFELVLVDNGSELPETETLLERLGSEQDVRIVRQPGPFNWAAINNAAARQCAGDVLLFMNNDIEAHRGGWLDALVGHAQRAEVGAVGARLVYPDGSIQHAGVAIGLGGIAGHVLRGLPGDDPGYNSIAISTRDCSVVTGACMMVRREVFEAVGGFDEQLAVAFNDVDFCLKLREAGYLVVFTPLAELIHHESKSRGHTDDFAESKRILSRWSDTIAAGDPYLNLNLSHWRYWCPLTTAQENDRWRNYLETSVLTRGSSSST